MCTDGKVVCGVRLTALPCPIPYNSLQLGLVRVHKAQRCDVSSPVLELFQIYTV